MVFADECVLPNVFCRMLFAELGVCRKVSELATEMMVQFGAEEQLVPCAVE